MKTKVKILITVIFSLAAVGTGIAAGSVALDFASVLNILSHKMFGAPLGPGIVASEVSILWRMRLPRVFLAFLTGSAISVSGAVMQSVLRNPLASSYTLGVSSGASLGAGLVIVYGFSLPFAKGFTLPVMGLVFGLLTVFIAVSFAAKINKNMENHTVILAGMVFSLFVNAIVTMLMAFSRNQMQRLIFWQMGSFSMGDNSSPAILAPIVFILTLVIMRFSNELDIMTFGEEQARIIGVDIARMKWLMLGFAAVLAGSAVSFAGVIGFIDLVVPHLTRKLFGSAHRLVIPMSMVLGGGFMVLCDLVARTVISPSELPVGAITALIGAPFFAYVYLKKHTS